MKENCELQRAKGMVQWRTGGRGNPWWLRSNVVAYTAADLMARMVGGDTSYCPRHIGFMYGADPAALLLADPDLLPDNIRRNHSWDVVTTDAAAAHANVLICPLVLSPGYASTGSVYTGNEVTVAGFTGVSMEYAYPTTGATFAAAIPDIPTVYFYQAIFLNRRVIGANTVYTPFARVTLRNPDTGNYDAKPAGAELSLFWTITFA